MLVMRNKRGVRFPNKPCLTLHDIPVAKQYRLIPIRCPQEKLTRSVSDRHAHTISEYRTHNQSIQSDMTSQPLNHSPKRSISKTLKKSVNDHRIESGSDTGHSDISSD
jgi:hypothetical protein